MNSQRQAEEILNGEIKNLKYWSSYYSKEAIKIQNQLSEFGLDKNDLLNSFRCTTKFNNLVSLAQLLKIDEINIPNFTFAIRELMLERYKNESTIFNLENDIFKFNEKLVKLNLFEEALIKNYKALNNELPEERKRLDEIRNSLQFAKNKIEKYTAEIDMLESYNRTIDKSIYHENIMRIYEHLKATESQLNIVVSELQRYDDLPPNFSLARFKIQTLKNEIDRLDQEIDMHMNMMY